jgi:hypothetical protein
MKLKLSRPLAAAALVALAAVGSAAQARDNVYWSIGVDAAPGVSLGVGNTRPVYVQPAPVYIQPAPVYVAPQPVYVAPRPVVLVRPAPVYYEPVYVRPGKHKRHRHHRHWD